MDLMKKHTMMITCAHGLSSYVAAELKALGYEVKEERRSGVDIEGNIYDAMVLNLHLRSAYCVQMLLHSFDCTDVEVFYREIKKLWWERIIPPDSYVSVSGRADNSVVKNTMFVNMKAKDAIVDRIAEKTSRRPDSGSDRSKIVVNIYWYSGKCYVYLNTTGQKLSDRGYRKMPHRAPLQECLAASMIAATGYDGTQELVLPMCGSGTLAIEAALIAQNRAPGLLRSNYAFMHYNKFDEEYWRDLRVEARAQTDRKKQFKIIASDIDPTAIVAARQNAKTAGVDNLIEFEVCDFAESKPSKEGGIVLMNPEYGMRLGEEKKLESLYTRIGDYFKADCTGGKGYIFTGNFNLAKKIGLRTSRRLVFYNADIECRLLEYELYKGTKKEKD